MMDPARELEAEAILAEAVELPQESWPELLEKRCGEDQALRQRVESLLHAYANGRELFESSVRAKIRQALAAAAHEATAKLRLRRRRTRSGLLPEAVSDVTSRVEALPESPTSGEPSTVTATSSMPPVSHIGPYRLLETIGEGGMGVVYLAEQERPIRRRVALKLVKLGMDTKEVVARFEAERQALALMDHPSIAKVYDAGATEQGRPYFVMEHVAGERITEYCNRHRLPLRERLRLFLQVCNAIQHAHQKAIIHRDLKPSNVLVTIQDDTPMPKVIDFGVAKAMSQKLTEKTVYTALGELIGTLEYMSPEQAEMTGLNVDTRTDIYSLGVMLYELLVGTVPFDARTLRELGLEGIQKTLREKEPEPPSARVSRLEKDMAPVAERRRTTAPALLRQLRHELDWITMRALEKDRTRRYQTASEFAADIERYLHDEPVLAGPPSKVYRVRKFAKRQRGLVLASAAVLVAIVLFGSISLWQANIASREGSRARANGILAAAVSARDPLVRALLVLELDGLPGLTADDFSKAYVVLGTPLPVAALGKPEAPALLSGRPAWRRREQESITTASSSDGSHIAVASRDGTIRVWRADFNADPVVLRGHPVAVGSLTGSPIHDIEFSFDGKRIVSCGWDRLVRIWSPTGGDPIVLSGHEDWVYQASFSPDGARIVTASADGTARIWRSDGIGDPIILRGHVHEVRGASFSPDGTRVVTASLDGTARVWQVDGAGEPIVFEGHSGRVNTAAFSPDGQRVVTTSDDGTARVWHADGDTVPVVLDGHEARVNSAMFCPDGSHVVTASADGTGRVWRVDGSGEEEVLRGHTAALWSAEFSADDTSILTASEDGTARLWRPVESSAAFGYVTDVLSAEPYRGRKVRFRAKLRVESVGGSATGQMGLAVLGKTRAGFDADLEKPITSDEWRAYELVGDVTEDAVSIQVWILLEGPGRVWADAASLETVGDPTNASVGLPDGGFESADLRSWYVGPASYKAKPVEDEPAEGRRCLLLERGTQRAYRSDVVASQDRGIRVASLAASGTTVVTASNDGTARVWRTEGAEEPQSFKGHQGAVRCAAFSLDGEYIVTASLDSTARVWRTDRRGQPRVLRGHGGGLLCAAFSLDGEYIVTASMDSTARVWRTDGQGESLVLRGHNGVVACAGFSPDGRHIVTASWDSTARVWSADGRAEPEVLRGHEGALQSAAFSPDGRRIATASRDGTLRVWRSDGTGRPIVLESDQGVVNSAAFSGDGQHIVAALDGGSARVWRVDGKGEPLDIEHKDMLLTAAFDPDGGRIVTGGDDALARVWRADGRGEPIVLRGHGGSLYGVAFSPDGQRVLTASADRTARLWRVTWEGLFDYLQASVVTCLGPEERALYLGETRAEAWRRYVDCERRHGRIRSISEADR